MARHERYTSEEEFNWPKMMNFSNEVVRGVNLTDQIIVLHEYFFKILMMGVRNAHVLHDEIKCMKTSFIPYLITIVEDLIALGRNDANLKEKPQSHWAYLEKRNLHSETWYTYASDKNNFSAFHCSL